MLAECAWIALGDSFTAGTGDTPECGGWVARTAVALLGDGLIDRFDNVAVPGARIGSVIADQVPRLQGQPALVSAIAGANDVLAWRWSLSGFSAQVAELLGAARRHGRLVLSSTCPDFFAHRFGPSNHLSRRIEQLNALVMHEVEAAAGQLLVLDVHRIMQDRSVWHADGIHPNPLGHEALAVAAVAMLGEPLRRSPHLAFPARAHPAGQR